MKYLLKKLGFGPRGHSREPRPPPPPLLVHVVVECPLYVKSSHLDLLVYLLTFHKKCTSQLVSYVLQDVHFQEVHSLRGTIFRRDVFQEVCSLGHSLGSTFFKMFLSTFFRKYILQEVLQEVRSLEGSFEICKIFKINNICKVFKIGKVYFSFLFFQCRVEHYNTYRYFIFWNNYVHLWVFCLFSGLVVNASILG